MFGWFGKCSFVAYSKVQDFAVHLKEGRLMGSRCRDCGFQTFPPRADCPECLSANFEFQPYSGQGTLYTWTRIHAAPTGFEDMAPYTIAIVDLDEGGRALAWLGSTLASDNVQIGMAVQLVPRLLEESEQIHVYYTVEKPGTKWSEAPPPHRVGPPDRL